ncbi:hypothetical protein [uncultured Roseobacter sp.]|uniref:hypothetical protein n=1 Tax=uncultured Roseobacter sp. TaxID=114847 RepID=UPI002637CA64|nr:hypothetical protein [uncultured Roseobacter sp.]
MTKTAMLKRKGRMFHAALVADNMAATEPAVFHEVFAASGKGSAHITQNMFAALPGTLRRRV